MHLSADTNHLLQKQLRQVLQPSQVAACALLSLGSFAAAYLHRAFQGSAQLSTASLVSLLALVIFAAASTALAVTRFRARTTSRAWIAIAVGMWLGIASGFVLGGKAWQKHGVNYYSWKQMASYVNVDPEKDKGQSFMDAGVVYFKERSHVQRHKALAFHNGRTFCVAPIVRQDGGELADVAMPRSGTVDFWAVGTDCCGRNGEDFHCDDSESARARSGLRLLDGTSRSMYLLAVQEWSATLGLPVRHPLFFHWVRDPVAYQEQVYQSTWDDFVPRVLVGLVLAFGGSLTIHGILQKLKVA